ncbi:MAG: HAD family hydrolase [Candidatus Helarchaeota archaeon]
MATTTVNNLKTDNIKAIVFDWDGALFNSVPAIKAATQSVLERFNITFSEDGSIEELRSLMENIHENNLPTILLNHYEILNKIPYFSEFSYLQKLQVLFMIYSKYKEYTEISHLYAGTKELLEQLSQKFDLVVFSSAKREEMIATLEKFGILNYFKSIFTADNINYPKPHPECMRKMIRQMNYYPANVLYVGDTVNDIRSARAVNMPSIAISSGLIPKQSLLEHSPNLICDHITELTQLFDLPKISVDLKEEQERTIDYHAEKIKTLVKEDFNFFSLLQTVLPPDLKFEREQIVRIIQDPLGFIGAIITDGIAQYTRGEIELQTQFMEFADKEEDLLKCLGLIIIHFVNERSNNLLKKLIENPMTKVFSLSTITAFGIKVAYQHLYPYDYKERFRKLFLKFFGNFIPNLDRLREMDCNAFTNSVLDGCELAIYDLGLPKVKNLEFKQIQPFSLSFSNLLWKVPTMLLQEVWKRVTTITQDILENDFRCYPGECV